MSASYLIDTNVLSELIRPVPNEGVLRQVALHERTIALGAPALHEAYFGMLALPFSRRRQQIEDFLYGAVVGSWPVLPCDDAAARWQA